MKRRWIIVLFLMVFGRGIFFSSAMAETYHIPDDYLTLQTAINNVDHGDTIIVRDGTWTGTGFRNVETLSKAITIRSENGPDACIIDCSYQGRAFYIHNSEERDTIIDGFKIKNGVADGSGEDGYGAGIYIGYCSPTIKNCYFEYNNCTSKGGGIYAHGGFRIQNCTFYGNHADSFGGGAFVISSGDGEILGCTFYYNEALNSNFHGSGGGLKVSSGTWVVITDCIFTDNSAESGAAAMISGSGQIYNCLFFSNHTLGDHPPDQAGAGIYFYGGFGVFNCTFNGNTTAGYGASIYVDGGATPVIRRSIIWDNSTNGIVVNDGGLTVSYSDVTYNSGTYPGVGNMNAYPDFADGTDGEYYLSQIAAGQTTNSPCLNAGYYQANSVCYTGASGQEICLDDYTTRTDEVNDSGEVDIGYHYPQPIATPTPVWTSTPPSTSTPTRTPTRTFTPTYSPTWTPTALPSQPTYTPIPTGTPTRTPRPTSTPTRTPIPTRTPTRTPTAPPGEPTYTSIPTNTPVPPTSTPSCTTFGCTVTMPLHDFGPGDPCWCSATICNTTIDTYPGIPVFILLDVFGSYFFAPSFSEFDFYVFDITPGAQIIEILPAFSWPSNTGQASGIFWYAAMTDPEVTQLIGQLGSFEFGWHS